MKSLVVFLVGAVVGVVALGAVLFFGAARMMVNERQSPVGVEETVARITKAAEAEGWKVLEVRKLDQSIKKNTGQTIRPVHLVDLCEPNHAKKILEGDAARSVSVFMPCTISVYEKSDGKAYVASTNAKLLGRLFGGVVAEVMGGPVAESQARFVEAVDRAP